MATLVEKIAETRDARATAERAFREALTRGRAAGMSWNELAQVAGLKPSGVRYLVEKGADNGAD